MKARKPASGWSAPFSRPLTLRDGMKLETLADARAFVLMLPPGDQERQSWQKAAELLIEAAENVAMSGPRPIRFSRRCSCRPT